MSDMEKTKVKQSNPDINVPEKESSPLSVPSNQEPQDAPDFDGWRHEYSEVNNDIRNHTNLRFTIFSVYLAALGGMISIAFGFFETKSGNPEHLKQIGRMGGLLVTLLFFCYELRLQSLINHNLKVGKKLEKSLGYTHITDRKSWGWFRNHHVTILFFLIIIVFWLEMIFS